MEKYIKALVIQLDPFESKVIFEKNYRYDEVDVAKNELAEYDYGGNICQAFEMSMDMR